MVISVRSSKTVNGKIPQVLLIVVRLNRSSRTNSTGQYWSFPRCTFQKVVLKYKLT